MERAEVRGRLYAAAPAAVPRRPAGGGVRRVGSRVGLAAVAQPRHAPPHASSRPPVAAVDTSTTIAGRVSTSSRSAPPVGAHVFGEVADDVMRPSPLGRDRRRRSGERTVALRPEALADASVVMPNHVHFLFGIVDVTDGDSPDHSDANPHRTDTINCVPTPPEESARADGGRQFGAPLAKFRVHHRQSLQRPP